MKKIINTVIRFLNNLKLRTKLLFSYLLIIAFLVMVFSQFTYSRISHIIEDNIFYSAQQSFDQTYAYLCYRMDWITQVSDVIVLDRKTRDILSKDIETYDLLDQMQDMNDLIDFLSSFEDKTNILKVRLYIRDGLLYSNENRNLFNTQSITDTDWYEKTVNSSAKAVWLPYSYFVNNEENTPRVISAVRTLKNSMDLSMNVAILRVDIEEKKLSDIISKANTFESSLTYIQNSDGRTVVSSDPARADEYRIDADMAEQLSVADHPWTYISHNNEVMYARSMKIANSDWYMISIIPFQEILVKNSKIKNDIILILIFIGLFAYILAGIISFSITKRVSHLIRRMKDVQQGNLDIITQAPSKDEFGELIVNYNFMISKMVSMIEEKYKAGLDVKSSELKALQAQINPHFLYNSLDMINWMAQDNLTHEVETAITALANFYKLSLSKGKDIITVGEELDLVLSYVQIQNLRFHNKIKLLIDVDDLVLDCLILKITLQPIVENAILHGIRELDNKEGIIFIGGRLDNTDIVMTIQDNGIGIPQGKLDTILSGTVSSENGSGYGIKNINERIKLYYGDKYGLSYQSAIGSGTTVEIRFPYREGA